MRGVGCAQSFFLIVSLFSLVMTNDCQESDKSGTTGPVRLAKVVNRSGWTVPDVSRFPNSSAEAIDVRGRKVMMVYYESKGEIEAKVPSYFQDGEVLIVRDRVLLVRDLSSYSFNNHVFALKVRYLPYTITDGVKRILGALISRYYFDDDGDGKFEIMYDVVDMPVAIPHWAMKK